MHGFSSMMGTDLSLPGIDRASMQKRKLTSQKFGTHKDLQGGLGGCLGNRRPTSTWAEGHDFGRMVVNRSDLTQYKQDL